MARRIRLFKHYMREAVEWYREVEGLEYNSLMDTN
jgi:hypothetical protein